MLFANWQMWLSLVLVVLYCLKQWFWPAQVTLKHDQLRRDWLEVVTATAGSEVLGVQTIRNSLMSCTMTATAATLAFMGGVTLLYSAQTTSVHFQQHVLAVLVLLGLSFVMSMLAARQWHHAGFVAGMPTDSALRAQWLPLGQLCLKRAGHYYALAVRLLMCAVPVTLVGLYPYVGLAATLFLLLVLNAGIDR